jgi:hypothetical protein
MWTDSVIDALLRQSSGWSCEVPPGNSSLILRVRFCRWLFS